MGIVSGGGGGSFNGGTITGALTVAPTTSNIVDLLVKTANVPADFQNFSEWRSPTNVLLMDLDSSGSLGVFSQDPDATALHLGAPPAGGTFGGILKFIDNAQTVVYGGVKQAGHFFVATHAAPADADLNAGECALWFDQTDGAGNTKLMCKGKSANGTVKTATVATLA